MNLVTIEKAPDDCQRHLMAARHSANLIATAMTWRAEEFGDQMCFTATDIVRYIDAAILALDELDICSKTAAK